MPIHLEIAIQAPASKIFAVITNLAHYHKWLPSSSAFKGTTEVSDTPAKLGTTYLELGPAGIRKGEIVKFEEPTNVAFHQPMTMKPAFLGIVLDVTVEMTLKEDAGSTLLERDVTLRYPWVLWPFKLAVDNEFRRESWRTMQLLKKYVEGLT